MRAAGAVVLTLALMTQGSPVQAATGDRVVSGLASTYGEGYDGWLALPEGRGVRIQICGPIEGVSCPVLISNDAGPSLEMQRQGRIADLDIATFEYLCRCAWRTKGLINVTVTYLGSGSVAEPRVSLPPTDTNEGALSVSNTSRQLQLRLEAFGLRYLARFRTVRNACSRGLQDWLNPLIGPRYLTSKWLKQTRALLPG